MAQGGWTDTGGRCREAERFPAGGFALGKRAVEAFHGTAACAEQFIRHIPGPTFECRGARRENSSRSAGSRANRSSHSGKTPSTNIAKICSRSVLRRDCNAFHCLSVQQIRVIRKKASEIDRKLENGGYLQQTGILFRFHMGLITA